MKLYRGKPVARRCPAMLAVAMAIGCGTSVSAIADEAMSLWQRGTFLGDPGGVRKRMEDQGITLSLQEQSEIWANIGGGLRQGSTYDGLTTVGLKLDLDRLAGLPHTIAFASAYQIHGRGPTANLVGNLQVVSNLEATRATRLYDAWLETGFFDERLNLRIGQEGVNDEFMLSSCAATFLNASFGFPAVAATVLPSGGPNFPLSTPFIRAKVSLGRGFTVLGAVFNGDPAPTGTGDPQIRDPSGTTFRLNGHAVIIGELWYSPPDEVLPATYKLGGWMHTARFASPLLDSNGVSLANPNSSGVPREYRHDFGVYAMADWALWQPNGTEDQVIGAFAQVMLAPQDRNVSQMSITAGVNWKGPLPGRLDDVAGLAVAVEGIGAPARAYSRDLIAFGGTGPVYSSTETVIEATYTLQATPWLTLQPDVQYVINPGASIPSSLAPRPLRDDIIAGLRATVVF